MAETPGNVASAAGLLSLGNVRRKAVALTGIAMEALLLFMVCAAPWAYGAVHPGFEFLLYAGLGILLVLWAVRMLISGQLTWKQSPVAVCLAGLFLIGLWQMTPLPPAWLPVLSPATSQLYKELLPNQPEILTSGESRAVLSPPPGSTISLYPTATRQASIQFLAVFLLFAVVSNNIASAASLKRLAIAALANGTLLSLFALVQFFSAKPDTLYWTYSVIGHVFGSFGNRNHFACYVNLCVGLGIGLIVSRNAGAVQWRGQATGAGRVSSAADSKWLATVAELLNDPPTLAACFAVTLMASSVAFSLSRGGVLALAGGVAVFAGLMAARPPHSLRLGIGLILAALAIALSSWLGYGVIKARLASLQDSEAIVSRLDIWSDALPLLGEFPVWGTGYGTFQYVERMQRKDALSAEFIYDHAHNDYLELLVEGGIFALGLGLFAIGAISYCGIKAVKSRRNPATAGLVAGAMLGFTTLVLHSIGEFGTHIPAITLLATVIAAQVCAQGRSSTQAGRSRPVESKNGQARSEYQVSWWGLAPTVGAVACVGLAAVLCAAGWKAHLVDRLRVAADEAAVSGTAQAQQTRVAYLKTAASLAPDDAELLAHLGNVGLRTYDLELTKLEQGTELALTVTVWPTSLLATPNPAMAAAQLWGLLQPARQELLKVEEARLARALVMPALQAYLQARDSCPLFYEVQLGIGANLAHLARADAQRAYLHRAQLSAPADPEVWYLSGLLHLEAKQLPEAWSSWNRCLELSDRYLTRILDRSLRSLSSEEIVAKVFPPRPEWLLAAAVFLGPKAPDEKRLPFLEKALQVISSQSTPLMPLELYTKVQVYRQLGRNTEALETYRALVNSDPKNVKYRFELAQFFHGMGQLQEARKELFVVQAQDHGHIGARDLLATIEQEMLQRK